MATTSRIDRSERAARTGSQTGALSERSARYVSGWLGLLVPLALAAGIWLSGGALFGRAVAGAGAGIGGFGAGAGGFLLSLLGLVLPLVLGVMLVISLRGFTILEPNTAAVLTLFGRYNGTIREDGGGFFFYNPLSAARKLSIRIQNLATPTLKVNDLSGNPIEIGAVIAWQVGDTCRAAFAVSDYVEYIRIQSESALRQVAGTHPYDGADPQQTLRGNVVGVTGELVSAIDAHVAVAGIIVNDARIAHLAYAPEIAAAMLRKQQAEQVVAARQTIVEGAVGMVETALQRLEASHIVTLDPAQRAQLVTNLMTVLVGESDAQPVLQMSAQPRSSAADAGH